MLLIVPFRRNRRRFLQTLLTLVTLLGATQSWAELRIGITVGQFDNYIAYLVDGIKAHARTLDAGIQLQIEDSGSDVVRQLGHVENFISQQVDAIIVNPADTAATRRITQRATEAGIPLVYLNSRPEVQDFPQGVVFVGTDERQTGRMQMQYLAKQMGGKGNLAIILGRLSHDDTRKRTQGVKDVLAEYPDIHVVEEQSANWERGKGMDLMNNWMLSGLEIDAIAANNDEMGIGAAMAMRQMGHSGIAVVGIDGTPDGQAAIRRGLMSATLLRDPVVMGEKALDTALDMIRGQVLQGDIWIPVTLIEAGAAQASATSTSAAH